VNDGEKYRVGDRPDDEGMDSSHFNGGLNLFRVLSSTDSPIESGVGEVREGYIQVPYTVGLRTGAATVEGKPCLP